MSWQIVADSTALIYDPRLVDYKLTVAKLEQELNKADNLSFFLYPQHPSFSAISRLKSTIVATESGNIKSRCRMLDDEIGWENGKLITCEGELAFLHDSIQRPFSFPADPDHATPADLFSYLITQHNAQVSADRQFVVGNCTVTDPNNYISRSDTEYSTTWQLLNEQLIDTLGGYLWVRHENGQNIIDYLADFSVLANQPIKAGLNLLSIKTERKGAEIATAILPLGKANEDTNQRLTISDLADSTTSDICKEGDIVYSAEAETLYGGRITKVVVYDDVTTANALLSNATAELGIARQLPSTITLSAADLSAAGYNFNAFSLGTYVDIEDPWHSSEHGLLARYLIKHLSLDLLNPSNNTLTLGAETLSFTQAAQANVQSAMQMVETKVTQDTAYSIKQLETQTQSVIEQSQNSILISVSENTYTKDEVNGLVSSLETSIQTTADGIEIQFTSLEQDLDDVANSADARFNALQTYIRASGGVMTFGEVGSEITLQIENDRIGIYSNGVLLTYWTADDFVSPTKLHIPVGGKLYLGDFAFIPRSSGSLDFTWVGA